MVGWPARWKEQGEERSGRVANGKDEQIKSGGEKSRQKEKTLLGGEKRVKGTKYKRRKMGGWRKRDEQRGSGGKAVSGGKGKGWVEREWKVEETEGRDEEGTGDKDGRRRAGRGGRGGQGGWNQTLILTKFAT